LACNSSSSRCLAFRCPDLSSPSCQPPFSY
jgi:hypothetical protein